MTHLLQGAKLLCSENSQRPAQGLPCPPGWHGEQPTERGQRCPIHRGWPHLDPQWGFSEMEEMSSVCQVPTQPIRLDTCMCSYKTPCFVLTQVPASPKEVSVLALAPLGCIPLVSRGAPCSAPWGPACSQMHPRTRHLTRSTTLHPLTRGAGDALPPWFGVTSGY